ncbi:MAG: DUF1858 domain-containing protein [Isosphaeraceae bacterium]
MITNGRGKFAISPDLLLPDLFRAHPETRMVFDRHGLRGCGGPLGPCESIRFFARAHGVDELTLVHELELAVAAPRSQSHSAATTRVAPEIADTIYRRYFLAGIAVVLSAGASWGAWLLWTIGLNGSFRAVSVHAINAHGEAQIFGWVGLFIMGFAYQAFPRMWQTTLVAPRLAVVAFGLMVGGLLVRTVGITAAEAWTLAAPLALAGGLMQITAVGLFVGQLLVTFRRSGAAVEAYVGFVIAALGWFLLSSVFSVWHSWHTMTAPNLDALTWSIATYQAPLRDLQIHGLALFMILGVSLRMLPAIYGLPRVPERRAWWVLGLLTTAVAGETIVFLVYRWTGNHLIAAGLIPTWAIMTMAVLMISLPWRLWRPMPEPDRTGKFVRAAYTWLPVSLVMLMMMPFYNRLVGVGFSHAYFGATRHAITVGFISLMIMGMAAKVVPALNGVDPLTLSNLRGPFLLVNLGCFLRVTMQVATDWTHYAYPPIGMSGVLEVTGLAWWGLGLAVVMRRGRLAAMVVARPAVVAPVRIEANHLVADVLEWFPRTEDVFFRHGFTALKSAVLRRTLARQVTVAQAAALRGINLTVLLNDLNDTARGPLMELPVLSQDEFACKKGGLP